MLRFKCYVVFIFVFSVAVLVEPSVAFAFRNINSDISHKKYKIFILHSYNEDYDWVKDVNRGILSALNNEEHLNKGRAFSNEAQFDYKFFYMNTKNQTSKNYFKLIASKVMENIKSFDPDVIISSDDAALQLVVKKNIGAHYSVSFCGINGDPVEYGVIKSYEKPGTNVTGVVERFNYGEILKLAKLINPDIKTISIVFDNNITSRAVADAIKKYLGHNNLKIKRMILTNSWNKWREAVLASQEKDTLFLPIFFYTLKDSKGRNVDANYALKWLIENSKIPEYATTSFQVRMGFFASVSVRGESQGYEAAEKAIKILRGERPQDIPVTVPKIGSIDINLERAKMLGINVPFDLLSYSTIHKTMGVYESKSNSTQ